MFILLLKLATATYLLDKPKSKLNDGCGKINGRKEVLFNGIDEKGYDDEIWQIISKLKCVNKGRGVDLKNAMSRAKNKPTGNTEMFRSATGSIKLDVILTYYSVKYNCHFNGNLPAKLNEERPYYYHHVHSMNWVYLCEINPVKSYCYSSDWLPSILSKFKYDAIAYPHYLMNITEIKKKKAVVEEWVYEF